jgi:hypothetical protein
VTAPPSVMPAVLHAVACTLGCAPSADTQPTSPPQHLCHTA